MLLPWLMGCYCVKQRSMLAIYSMCFHHSTEQIELIFIMANRVSIVLAENNEANRTERERESSLKDVYLLFTRALSYWTITLEVRTAAVVAMTLPAALETRCSLWFHFRRIVTWTTQNIGHLLVHPETFRTAFETSLSEFVKFDLLGIISVKSVCKSLLLRSVSVNLAIEGAWRLQWLE